MSRTNSGKEVNRKNSNEGTSARTRPVSVEEILSRRKNKLNTDVKEGDGQARGSSEKDDRRVSSDRGLDIKKDTEGTLKGDLQFKGATSKKERLEGATSKKDRLEGETYKKDRLEEAIYKLDHKHFQNKDEGNRDSETKTKVKSIYSKSSRDKENKNEKQTHHRSRVTHHTGADFEKESKKQLVKISKGKDKHEEREGKFGKEGKRKHESYNDDKNRFVVAGSITKKHDRGKLHDSEYSEREGRKKEHSRTQQEGPRAKRKRSSSRDHDRGDHDRGRDRSTSISPRAHRRSDHGRDYDEATVHSSKGKSRKKYSDAGDMYKTSANGGHGSRDHDRGDHDRGRDRSTSISPRAHRRSDHGMDYDEATVHSSKEKSRKKYSDAGDMYKTSANGGHGSGHYRKYGSGLGGYSPRKRRTESAVKTPSPTKRSPEKKISTWDQPPAGTNHGDFGPIFTNLQSPISKILESSSSTAVTPSAVTPSMTKSQPILALDGPPMLINASIESVQLTQATRPMRSLYIENLPPSASEKSVIDCLNDFLMSSGVNRIQGAKPCINCIIHKERCQAVVEFLTPEDATSAIYFDGRSLAGSVLKIRRPKDYVEAATGAQEKTVSTVKAMSGVVKDSSHKIFIGGISKALSSEMLLEIAGAFGLLRAYRLEYSRELNGQCAFLEYDDHSITHKACAGLNGMKIGGHVLTAVQAFLDTPMIEDDAENLPTYAIPSHARPLLADPTQVLQLKNVLAPEEFPLLTDSELDELLEDIKLECARFGTVKSINLVRFNNKSGGASDGSDQQELHAEPANCSNQEGDDPPASNVVEQQDVGDATEKTYIDDETTVEDYEMMESASTNPIDGGNHLPGDPCSLENGAEVNVEEAVGMEGDSVPEVTVHEVDIAGEKIADLKIDASTGEGEQIPVQTTSPSVCAADEGKPANGESHLTDNVEVFEPGCVFVEFLRKEAACAAAHCLHQRCYGERIVSVSYVSLDLYTARFPR